jgi:hypothetical protein
VGVGAANLAEEEGADVHDLGNKVVAGEELLHAREAEQIPMVIFARPDEVLGGFVHLEKADANAKTGHAADFVDGLVKSGEGKVFEEVVDQAEVKGFVGDADFEDIAWVETYARVEGAGVFDVGLAQVKSRVIEEPGKAELVEESVIIG